MFYVNLLGVIFNTKTRKILIGRRENDPYMKELTWSFPGGILSYGEDSEKILIRKIKEKTGLEIVNLGCIFARAYPEKKELLSVYFLCEVVGGKEKAKDHFKELKWVKPEEIERYFKKPIHPRVKEFILNIK